MPRRQETEKKILTETYPKHWLDKVLWPILRFTLEPFTKKQSHGWQWFKLVDELIPGNIYFTRFEGDEFANRDTGVLSSFWQKNFEWDKVALIRPKKNIPYRVGFRTTFIGKKDEIRLCSIVCDSYIGLLIGPDNVEFFALSYPNNEPLEWTKPPIPGYATTFKDKLNGTIPLI